MLGSIVHWILDFLGVNNGFNDFSTHMYNFWSGIGGNISVLALIGTIFGVYRHHLTRLKKLSALNPLNMVPGHPLDHVIHKKDDHKS